MTRSTLPTCHRRWRAVAAGIGIATMSFTAAACGGEDGGTGGGGSEVEVGDGTSREDEGGEGGTGGGTEEEVGDGTSREDEGGSGGG